MAFNESSGAGGLLRLLLHNPEMSGAVILLVVASLMVYLFSGPKKLNLPIIGNPSDNSYGDAVLEGTAKVSLRVRLHFRRAATDSMF